MGEGGAGGEGWGEGGGSGGGENKQKGADERVR